MLTPKWRYCGTVIMLKCVVGYIHSVDFKLCGLHFLFDELSNLILQAMFRACIRDCMMSNSQLNTPTRLRVLVYKRLQYLLSLQEKSC